MRIGSYSFDVSQIIEEIIRKHYGRILLQLPDGIKMHAFRIVNEIEEKTNAKVLVSNDPCYGACDVPLQAAIQVNADMILQLGHLPIPNLRLSIPTLFVNVNAIAREEEAVKRAIKKLEGRRIGLLTTAQHIEKLPDMEKTLKQNGFIPVVGKGDKRIAREGQVLGCDVSTARSIEDKVNSFLFVGSGRFHALAVSLSTNKPVIVTNPFTLEILKDEIETEKNKLIRRRYGYITIAQNAQVFGIIVSTKPGQMRLALAQKIEEKLRREGRKVYRLVADAIEPNIPNNFSDIECLVSTACPRVAIDEASRFSIPVLTPIEIEILLGERGIENYQLDTIA